MRACQTTGILPCLFALTMSVFSGNEAEPVVPPSPGAQDSLYLVIDLSGSPEAAKYPVTHLRAAPAGGWTDDYKTTKLVLRRIPAGTFTMGSPANELGREADEAPHTVTLTRDFYIGIFEVTQEQWKRVTSEWAARYHVLPANRNVRPVEQVSYRQIREEPVPSNPKKRDDSAANWPSNSVVHADSFMGRLRAKTGLAGLDLPTEAQWEYACRAGTTTSLNSGKDLTAADGCPRLSEVGRYEHNVDPSMPGQFFRDGLGFTQMYGMVGTAKAGSYAPNPWGLYDMHGNVWEWCLDWYAPYPEGTATDPKGPVSGSSRALRGGSWEDSAWCCRSANRGGGGNPAYQNGGFGLRVAMTVP